MSISSDISSNEENPVFFGMEYLCCYTQSKALSKAMPLSVAVVGDPGCGKTSLIFRFSRNRLPEAGETLNSSLDSDRMDVTHGSRQIKLTLFDPSGHEDYAKVRALAYNQCDVTVVCFPMDSPGSLHRVLTEWSPEVKHLNKRKPFLLVGTKSDLREAAVKTPNSDVVYVTEALGKKTAKKIGAAAYFEFSIFGFDSNKQAKRIFGRAIREGLKFL